MRRAQATIMGMPAVIQVAEPTAKLADINAVFRLWRSIDRRFSPFRPKSELSYYNRGELPTDELSSEMTEVLLLSQRTSDQTHGYFAIRRPDGQLDPSGLVKGWAIWRGAELLKSRGYRNFYVEIAGDIQTLGVNDHGEPWRVGIRHPFDTSRLLGIITARNIGVATSGNYEQGDHIYNPHQPETPQDLISLTVVAANIYDADRFATAAFAMGEKAIEFIESRDDCEALVVTADGELRLSSGFDHFLQPVALR